MCCSMVSLLYISKRSKQDSQSKQSNHRKARKASKACKVSKASIFCIFVDVVCGGLLHLSPDVFCLLMILASSLLFSVFTLFRSHPPRRFPVPLPLQVPESACACRQLEVVIWVPFKDSSRRGESERGTKTTSLEEGPRYGHAILGSFWSLHFGPILGTFCVF